MIDYYLKFASEQEAIEAFTVVELTHDGKIMAATPDLAIDVIGSISKPTGALINCDGVELPVLAPISGYHVNIRLINGTLDESLLPFCITPNTPSRIFG